ncbi:MAG: hypothetical protein KBS60_02800, partial [Phascolarctobacterium sp.]|nr:hypothetical protein [Candidatus Phascolarctobacterium caballi]
NLDTSVTELHNTGIVNIGNDTDQTLNTKINSGALGIIGNITADSTNLATNKIDIAENKALTVNGSTALGEMLIENEGTLNLGIATTDTHNAMIVGGTVNLTEDYTTDNTNLLADTVNIVDSKTLKVTTAAEENGFIQKVTGEGTVEFANGKVTAYEEINSNIKLDENVDLTIMADNIKKSVEIGNNANLNLGDGTFASSKISGTNNGTVNFVGNVKVDGNLSIPKATFADGSIINLTVTEGGDAPLQVTDTITVSPDAKLFVSGATKGVTFNIVSGNAITSDFVGWTLNNIRGEDAEGRNVKAKSFAVEGNVYSILFKSAIPENTDIAKILENADGTPLMNWAEKVTDYFDAAYGDAGEAYTTNAINSMASANVLAGTQHTAVSITNHIVNSIYNSVDVVNRPKLKSINDKVKLRDVDAEREQVQCELIELGQAENLMPVKEEIKEYDKQVWASIVHSKEKVDGMKTGSLEQDSTVQYNGTTVGADLWSNGKGFGGVA